MNWNPEPRPDGKRPARPHCEVCKRLVVRLRCDDCGKKVCLEHGRERGGGHACLEHVNQLLLPLELAPSPAAW